MSRLTQDTNTLTEGVSMAFAQGHAHSFGERIKILGQAAHHVAGAFLGEVGGGKLRTTRTYICAGADP